MSAGVLASLHGIRAYGTSGRPRAGRRQYIICWLSLPIFLVTVVLSESMTSLLASLGLCGANIIVMWYRRKGAYRLLANVATTVGVPVAIVVMVYWDSMLELLGKDPTLTGRTELWELVKLNIAERPLFGWGLGAFWTDTNPLVAAISFEIGWAPPHAHNGLLELLLEIGLFGTAIFAFILVRNTVMAVKALQTPGRELAVTALFCIGATIMTGISESVLIDPSEVFVIIFFVSGLLCERAVRVHRASRRVATGYVRGLTSARPF
jgi:exopolysaccharide production protein ExoQ